MVHSVRLLKILLIVLAIPLSLAMGWFAFFSESQTEKLSEEDMRKFGSYVLAEHNKLYTAKSEQHVKLLAEEIFMHPSRFKKASYDLHDDSTKKGIIESIVSIKADRGIKVKQHGDQVFYQANIYRLLKTKEGEQVVEERAVEIRYQKDLNGIYKIVKYEETEEKEEKTHKE